ncbi:MAG: leucyl aminopeptidase, partial [Mycobacterium sp.]
MSTQPGYTAPTVTVATSLPKRGMGSTVLIVPVVTGADGDGAPKVVGGPFLDAEAIGEIEVGLRALGAKGGAEQVTRLHVPSLPVASVLAVGLGAP